MFALGRGVRFAIAVGLALGAAHFACTVATAGAAGYCASGSAPRAPVPVPPELVSDVAKAFNLPVDVARRGAFVRCAGSRLLACAVGANLNCGKANARRLLPGASAFCAANPDADNVPMFATGHDTIYAWRCAGRRPVATKAIVGVDGEGYNAGNWKPVDR